MAIIKIHKGIIYDFYIRKRLSISKCAEILGVQWESARSALHRFGIKVRPKGGIPRIVIPPNRLRSLYVSERKSAREIAKTFGCGETIINKLLHKANIPIRERADYIRGKSFSMTHRLHLSAAKIGVLAGRKNPNWKGGVSLRHTYLRKHRTYQLFRRMVIRLKGDKCSKCKKDLTPPCHSCHRPLHRHVHHLKPFSDYPDQRTAFKNAVVLCVDCHQAIHHT